MKSSTFSNKFFGLENDLFRKIFLMHREHIIDLKKFILIKNYIIKYLYNKKIKIQAHGSIK